MGLTEKYKMTLRAPNSVGVAAGDFKGEGKIAPVFISSDKIRIFYQTRLGVEASYFTELDISALSIAVADIDGDGYDDLAIASHKKEGHHVCDSYIYWGGPDGINDQRYTKLPTKGPHGMCSVDIGNIMDRGDSKYYYSEAYEIPKGSVPTKVSWVAENGPATKVTMQVRCAHSPEALENTPWQGNFECGDTLELLSLHGSMQYRLVLTAKCGCGTPRVTEVTVDFR